MKYMLLLFLTSTSIFADDSFYLDKKTGKTWHICAERPDGKVMVAYECTGFFSIFFKEQEKDRADLVKYVEECDGIRKQEDLVMLPNNVEDILWAAQVFEDGDVHLISETKEDQTHYFVSNVKDLIREVPEYKGYGKGEKVCLNKSTTFEDRLPGSYVQPFPVDAKENSEFVLEHIFANGYAKVKYKDKYQLTNGGHTSILQAVPVDYFHKCK